MIDRLSPTWKTLTDWVSAQRAELQRQLAVPGLEHGPTELIRGRLKQLDELQRLAEPPLEPIPSGPQTTDL